VQDDYDGGPLAGKHLFKITVIYSILNTKYLRLFRIDGMLFVDLTNNILHADEKLQQSSFLFFVIFRSL